MSDANHAVLTFANNVRLGNGQDMADLIEFVANRGFKGQRWDFAERSTKTLYAINGKIC